MAGHWLLLINDIHTDNYIRYCRFREALYFILVPQLLHAQSVCEMFMSQKQDYIQELEWVIRHLQWEIATLWSIVEQLHQEEDPDMIIVETKAISHEHPAGFVLPAPTLDSTINGQPISSQLKNISLSSKMVSRWRIFIIDLPYSSPNANAWVNAHRMMNKFLIKLMMLSLRSCYKWRLNAKKQRAMHGHLYLQMLDAQLSQLNGTYQLFWMADCKYD